jgi:hypothetical protein
MIKLVRMMKLVRMIVMKLGEMMKLWRKMRMTLLRPIISFPLFSPQTYVIKLLASSRNSKFLYSHLKNVRKCVKSN